MDSSTIWDPEILQEISFVGSTLSTFFLNDPSDRGMLEPLRSIAELNVQSASIEWPFLAEIAAAKHLSCMVEGLSEESSEEALKWEFRRLFVGPQSLPTPPWGSVYTDHDGVIFGLSTLALRRWMRANGIIRLGEENLPEDHMGLMLSQMSVLAQQRPECLGDFLSLHLLTWSEHYLIRLEKESTHPFYQGLAALTNSSLKGIQETFALEVEYPRYYR